MKTINRVDIVPIADVESVAELAERAKKCGLIVKDILDIIIDEKQYKELLFTGTRWSYIKYICTSIVKDGVELDAIPGILKLMFMR